MLIFIFESMAEPLTCVAARHSDPTDFLAASFRHLLKVFRSSDYSFLLMVLATELKVIVNLVPVVEYVKNSTPNVLLSICFLVLSHSLSFPVSSVLEDSLVSKQV